MPVVARRFRIKGRVQGVFFRESTRQEAINLSLTGHAINLADGSVEVLACGTSEAISALESWLQQGPPLSRVASVNAEDVDIAEPIAFSTA
jgi:acylphosphatase